MLQIILILLVTAFVLVAIGATMGRQSTAKKQSDDILTWDSNGNGPRDSQGIRRHGSTRAAR
jgi:ABC-type glycerol-3-phosphate transport system substrate-binding protein